jgi:hypothetical protein
MGGKVKFSYACQKVYDYRGRRVTAPLFLNLGAGWRCMVSFTPPSIPLAWKKFHVSEGGWLEPRADLGVWERRQIFCPYRESKPNHLACTWECNAKKNKRNMMRGCESRWKWLRSLCGLL